MRSFISVEKYYYDNAGEIVRKEAYVEGEELKTGIQIEEHVFNDKGFEIQSFTYNSLDPSSKFYTENEVDENGRTLAAFDESGEHKTVFDYERDGVTVKTERLPNGSKFSYGRDKDGNLSAITHSTETGEENSEAESSAAECSHEELSIDMEKLGKDGMSPWGWILLAGAALTAAAVAILFFRKKR